MILLSINSSYASFCLSIDANAISSCFLYASLYASMISSAISLYAWVIDVLVSKIESFALSIADLVFSHSLVPSFWVANFASNATNSASSDTNFSCKFSTFSFTKAEISSCDFPCNS